MYDVLRVPDIKPVKRMVSAHQGDRMEKRLVIRSRPWRQPLLFLFGVPGVAVLTAIVTTAKGTSGGWVVPLVVVILPAGLAAYGVTAKVTIFDDIVRGPAAAHKIRPQVVPREYVNHIRALRASTVFYDRDRIPVMKVTTTFTKDQLITMGHELGVTVWEHRAWHGLRELENGVRLTEPLKAGDGEAA